MPSKATQFIHRRQAMAAAMGLLASAASRIGA